MASRPRTLRTTLAVVAGFGAILVLAASAGAESKAGEGAEPLFEGHPGAQATLVKASASYESTAGTVFFNLTLGAKPQEGSEGARVEAMLFATPAGCSIFSLPGGGTGEPILVVGDEYTEPTSTEFGEEGPAGEIEELGPAVKSVSGTMVTYSFSSSKLAGQGFNCAQINAGDNGGLSLLVFPLKIVLPPPPSPPASPGGSTTTPEAQAPGSSSSAPAPAPAALSIGKLNPVALKAGGTRSVTVKVTNTGGTATSRGTLRVRAPKGVLVKPANQPLPVLTPRGSCTVTLRLQLTKKAKPKSTLSLTASASGVTATGSIVAKLKKG
jgi:hypothetical protein